jgi:hypothetical protein
MRKIFGLVCLIYSAMCFSHETVASSAALVGDWEGQRCQSYNDGTAMGTYNFNFKANGQLLTYIQYYDGWCTGSKGMVSQPVVTGSYEILSSTENNGQIIYEMSFHYSHTQDQSMTTKAIVSGNTLQLCRRGGTCSSYVRTQ